MAHLFDPLTLRGVTLRNRIVVSPMCEYSSHDGLANDWHLVHLGSRAVGGAGLVITEAAAVTAQGRITAADLGIYRDEHVAALARIVDFIVAQGAVAGIQLAHAGRKASTREPWAGGSHVAPSDGGWQTVAPSAIAPGDDATLPTALSLAEIEETIEAFVIAAKRAIAAGFRVIEIHAAHGYLVHEFFSPLTNTRVDQFGGSFENRTRIAREIVRRVRAAIPDDVPLFTRISATDWVDGGWNLDESVALSRDLAALGCDLIDVSSGGLVRTQQIAIGPHYQVPFAQRTGQSDLVFLARELLRDPYWPLHAAHTLGVAVAWPKQYERAKPPALVGAKGG
jgi:2,4-dienoyl-CoA reductase-like NADH-dependent reductase (Old Yellow Enzyme family)